MQIVSVKNFYTPATKFAAVILSLVIPLIASVDAQASNSYCFNFKNLSATIYDNHSGSRPYPDYSCDDFSSFDRLTGSVLSLAPFPVVGLVIWARKEDSTTASYQSTISQIMLGFDKANPENVRANSVIYSHELGHAIFDAILAEKVPLVRKVNSLRSLNDQRLVRFGLPIARLSESCWTNATACEKKISALFDKIPPDLRDAEENLSAFKRQHSDELSLLEEVASPYHELFADIVASVYFEDPDVTSRAVSLFVKNDQSCRSFSKALNPDFHSNDPHCSLSLIRRQLWAQIIAPGLRNKREVVRRIGEVFADEISVQLNSRQKPDYINSQPQLNRISRILELE